ncbi:uncharacterized protein [Equus caballus]|uniref:uncharacterized protein n=1 Tax=Equus caballus TaxID=9796 RepID=UPI0038B397A3
MRYFLTGSNPTRAPALFPSNATLRRSLCLEREAALEAMTKEREKKEAEDQLALSPKVCQACRRRGRRRAGQGSSALCNILGSFEAVHEIPASLAPPPAAASQSQGAWPRSRPRERRRGGEDATGRLRGEPAAASSPSALQARSGSPAPAGEEEAAPQLGQQQVGSSAAGLLRPPNCSLALGKASYSARSPTLPFLSPRWRLSYACSSKGLRGANAGAKRLQPGRIAFQPGRVSLSPPSHPELTSPESPAEPAVARRSRELNGERDRDRDRRAEPSWI